MAGIGGFGKGITISGTVDWDYVSGAPKPVSRSSLPKIATIGSSYTEQQNTAASTTLDETGRSWIGWWHVFSGGAFNKDVFIDTGDTLGRNFSGSNFGVSGQSSTQILSRIQSVISKNPFMCILQSGSNNVASVSTVVSDVTSSIDALYQAGILPVYLAISARGAGSWSATTQQNAFSVNQQILDYCKRTGKAIYIDPNTYIIDNDAASGRPYTNAIDSDEIHYNQFSAFQIGKILHQRLTPLLPTLSNEISSYADSYQVSANPYGNILPNPFFSTASAVGTVNGTAGTNTSAQTGNAATSIGRDYRVEVAGGDATVIASLVSRGAGLGNWQKLEIVSPASAGNSSIYVRSNPSDQTTNFPPVGTWVIGSVDVSAGVFGGGALYSGFRGVTLKLETRDAAATKGSCRGMTVYATAYNLPNVAWSGRIYTNPFQIPVSADRLRLRTEILTDNSVTGTGFIEIGSLCVRPVQEPKTIWGF